MRRWFFVGGTLLAAAVLVVVFARHTTPTRQPSAPSLSEIGTQPSPDVVPVSVPAPPEQPGPDFVFRHLVLDTKGDSPELCLRFSRRLQAQAEAHYGDYVSIAPPVRTALRAADDQLCIGGLAYGTDYTITLKSGLPSATGLRLATDETVPASLGDRAPLVDISGDGFILSREVAHGLTIQTVNVHRVKIHVLRMSDRLLPASLRGASREVQLSAPGLEGYTIKSLMHDSAAVIWKGTMDIVADHNRTVQTTVPLGAIITPGTTGAYLVVAEDAAHATAESVWTGENNEDLPNDFFRSMASHWVISTDIALTTFSGTDGLHVSARSLATALPMSGVTLDLMSVGQDVLGEAVTDSSGMVHFAPGLLRGQGAASASTVTAHAAHADFTILNLSRPAFDFSDRGVTGRPSPAPLQAFLYTERGIYRPGQTVELMALLRDRLGDAREDLPLTLVLRRPNGMEAQRWSQKGQKASGFHQGMKLSATAAHGTWSVDALADPAGEPVGHVTFEVQDYVPQQLKVTLAPVAAALHVGDPLPIDVQGDFLYGAPAAGLHGQADLRVVRDPEPVAAAKGWQFGLADEKVDDKDQTVDLPPADATGHTHADAKLDMPDATIQSPLKVQISAGLFEPSGRAVNDTREAKLRTRPVLIGLHTRFADARADTDTDAAIDIRVFSDDGTPIARPGLTWRLVEEQQLFDWFEEDRAWHWHYHVVDRDVAQGSIDATPGAPAAVTRRYEWGNYRLIVEDPDSGTTSSIRFRAGWGETADQADIPDKVHVSVDHASLGAGQTAKLRIDGPFAGHASIVVANDRVIETKEVEIAQGGSEIEVTQTPDWGAGAYVLVSMYRPLKQGTPHEPVRAVGVAWIATDAGPRTLKVDVGAPEKVTPQQDITVPVHVAGLAPGEAGYVTLAAVDEGILQLTRFVSPDPVGFLFGKRALGISMRDDYGKLLDGSADPGQVQGGDEGLGGAGLPVVSTRTVALFSGPVTLDANGDAKVTFAIPDFEGQLRFMAVAYTAHSAGQAQKTMIVRDPVVADIAMPRFLGTGDHAQLAVSLNDTDGPEGRYTLAVKVAGAASLENPHTIEMALKPGQHARDAIGIVANTEGVADITADLSGPNLSVHRSWQISIRSPHAPITLQQSAWQDKGQDFAIDRNIAAPFLPGTAAVSLGYSGFGGIDVPSLLQSLYRYPYGCTEQLTSTAFPLVYTNDPQMLGSLKPDQGVHDRVQQAIDTILDRQDETGEFGLWRVGDGEASTWLGVYALDFLTHAKEAGFAVPDGALQRSALWLSRAARGDLPERAYGYYAQGTLVTRAYAAYVLARTGRADLGDLRRLHDTLEQHPIGKTPLWLANDKDVLEPLALGQMAGAFSLMGDKPRGDDSFHMAVQNLAMRHWPLWWFDWSYASHTRDIAGLLAIAAETDQQPIVRDLLGRLSKLHYDPATLNTQEQASLLSAAHALNKGVGDLSLTVNGTPRAMGSTPSLAPTPTEIVTGYAVNNSSGRALWRTLQVSGAPREAPPALTAGYTIEKTFTTLDGKPLDPAHMRQNDRVIVTLHGTVLDKASHRTVVVDMLPAGWEIETTIRGDTQYAFLGPMTDARVREARDDRFVAAMDFGHDLRSWRSSEDTEVDDKKPHLEDDEFRVAYVARAITPGAYTLPEGVVQDMYRPAVMGRTVSGVAGVAGR